MGDFVESIAVDIDDLIEKLNMMKEDNFVSAKLTIRYDGYCKEISIEAVGIGEESDTSYGSLDEINLDF